MKNTGPDRKIGFRDNCTVTVEQTHCIVCFAPFPSMHTHAGKNMGPAETVLLSKLISLPGASWANVHKYLVNRTSNMGPAIIVPLSKLIDSFHCPGRS